MFRPAPTAIARLLPLGLILAAAVMLSGCNALQRLTEVGEAPKLSQVTDPTRNRDYQPVSMPMPRPQSEAPLANSLWRPGARGFFRDQRAGEVGDILTVIVSIEDSAVFDNTTRRTRQNVSESAGLTNFLGLETKALRAVLPDDFVNTSLVDAESGSDHEGTGNITRSETLSLRLAALVTQVLPNGNLVITGSQETRVNNELRALTVTGVIRPEDITNSNTISSDQIAEARISYGGRGTISDVQQPRYGQQIFDIIFPF